MHWLEPPATGPYGAPNWMLDSGCVAAASTEYQAIGVALASKTLPVPFVSTAVRGAAREMKAIAGRDWYPSGPHKPAPVSSILTPATN